MDRETVDAGVLATPDPHALDILATSQVAGIDAALSHGLSNARVESVDTKLRL